MRIHRVFSPMKLEPECPASLHGGAAHYLGRVLRVTAGDRVLLFNADGHDYVADVTAVTKKSVELEVRSRIPARLESPLKITVVQSPGRGDRMDQALQKCTELGATEFLPLFSERVELKLRGQKLDKRLDHWRAVVISACEQSGRAVVPEVLRPVSVPGWLERKSSCRRFVLDPQSDKRISAIETPAHIELAVGPEGGFSDSELEMMSAQGVEAIRIGPRILRTETAAPAALAVLQALGGDF